MGIVDRIKNILLTPKSEWDVIAAETTPTNTIIMSYVLPLAAVAAIAGFIGMSVIGMSMPFAGTYRVGFVGGLVAAIFQVVMAVVMVFVLAFIIDALAPTFGATKSMPQAIKVAAYAYTPVWVVSVLKIIPMLGVVVLLAAIYAIYLLYLGLPRLMKGPEDKAAGYTAVVVVVSVILAIVIGTIAGMLTMGGMGMGMGMGMGGMGTRVAPSVTYDANSPVGKLNDFAAKMQEQGKKMEAAEKSGNQKEQMAAAMGVLGTALSGGKGVDPVQIDALKPFVPASFAGMPQTSTQSERGGVQGLMTAKVEARYGANGKSAELEVIDTGGAAGLLGLASWMGVQGEREDANHREVTRKDGNRLVHEEVSKTGGSNKFSLVLNDRFVVSARGTVDIDTLKSSVSSLDLGKLEGLK